MSRKNDNDIKTNNAGDATAQRGAEQKGASAPGVEPGNRASNVKNIIAVMSGKGGVGKSSVSALLAAGLRREGYRVGVLDADVTGPSIPKIMGVTSRPDASELGLFPPASRLGVRVMSVNLLLENEDDPVVWRGPIIAGVVKQFWTDVVWGDLDYLIVDLPPGTGDAPLTVMQSLPLTGLVAVSSPQELAFMVVRKAAKMASLLEVPVLGLVENMAWAVCPHCGEKWFMFGEPQGEEAAENMKIPYLGSMPLDPEMARLADRGGLELYQNEAVGDVVEAFLRQVKK